MACDPNRKTGDFQTQTRENFMKKLLLLLLIVSMTALSPLSLTAADGAEPDTATWYVSFPNARVYYYADADHTQPLDPNVGLDAGETVYYRVDVDDSCGLIAVKSSMVDVTIERVVLDTAVTDLRDLAIPDAVLLGDFMSDGDMDNQDVTNMLQMISGQYLCEGNMPFFYITYTRSLELDYNGDGALDTRDVTLMMRRLAGWEEDHDGMRKAYRVPINPRAEEIILEPTQSVPNDYCTIYDDPSCLEEWAETPEELAELQSKYPASFWEEENCLVSFRVWRGAYDNFAYRWLYLTEEEAAANENGYEIWVTRMVMSKAQAEILDQVLFSAPL